jgi:hypothetical protein
MIRESSQTTSLIDCSVDDNRPLTTLDQHTTNNAFSKMQPLILSNGDDDTLSGSNFVKSRNFTPDKNLLVSPSLKTSIS